jgi:ABC-type transport system involved in multi-copper enzyme maturation permease subunit
MALICLISPTFAASAISSEREQQTFELLVASLANPMTILAGKVGGALCYLFLVLFGSLPIVSFIYWVGGVSILDVAVCYVIMLVSGVAYCTLSFFWSTLFRRGVLAQMVSVFSVIFLVIGIPAFAGFLRVIMEVSGAAAGWSDFWDNVAFLLVRTNPFYAQGEALWSRSAPPGSLWLKEVPAWMFLTGFYGALTLLAGLLAWLRLRSVRKWLT